MTRYWDAHPLSTPGHLGLRIIENPLLTEPFEDWSGVRSRARGERRRARGFPQNVRTIQVPSRKIYRIGDALHMHPEMAKLLR